MRVLLDLTRIRITLLVALSGATGHILAADTLSPGILWPVLGLCLLTGGASALNQVQERKQDARMVRTRARPLPAGRMEPGSAMATAFTLLLAGLAVLYFGCGLLSSFLQPY